MRETPRHPSAQAPRPERDYKDVVMEEIKVYLEGLPLSGDEDPLQWWKKHADSFPNIAMVARIWLALPGSSTTSRKHWQDHRTDI